MTAVARGALDPRLERWLAALVATPGLTALTEQDEVRRLHVDDALTALPFVEAGPVVDVGSGGGSPGLPVAQARPDLRVDLLEASRRKCDFLRAVATGFANVAIVCARAEEHGRGAGRDAYATALARALAPPPVAIEWCLPLVRPGGVVVLYAGGAGFCAPPGSARRRDRGADLAGVSRRLGGGEPGVVRVPGSRARRLLVIRKLEPTPERFPRRPGAARKRPLE